MEIVADYHDLCGECPIWDSATSTLYWTDCVGLRFYRFHPSTKHHEMLKSGLEINGYRLNEPGGFVITNNSGIWLWDGAAWALSAKLLATTRQHPASSIFFSISFLIWFVGGCHSTIRPPVAARRHGEQRNSDQLIPGLSVLGMKLAARSVLIVEAFSEFPELENSCDR